MDRWVGICGCQVKEADPGGTASGGTASGGTASGGTASGGTASGGASEGGASSAAGDGRALPDAVREILNDPAVKSALKEARDQGVEIVTHTEDEAPDLTGYYSYALRAGKWIASGNGANIGSATTAAELRVDLKTEGSVDTAMVSSFDGVLPASYAIEEGYLLRGAAREVTLYGRRRSKCNLSGSSYAVSQAYIWTGTLADGTGDWLEQRQFTVTTATEGELTSVCAEALVGNIEIVGGWAAVAIPVATKVRAQDLEMMCVDEGRGYVPTEMWTRTDGSACECLTDFSISCEG
jgi:hypothetical protein